MDLTAAAQPAYTIRLHPHSQGGRRHLHLQVTLRHLWDDLRRSFRLPAFVRLPAIPAFIARSFGPNAPSAGHGRWAFDIKRGRSAKPEKGFYLAVEDLKPVRQFLVNSGDERYPIAGGLEAIGLAEMATVRRNL